MTMRDINRGVALSGWICIMVTCMAMVGSYCYAIVGTGHASPELTAIGNLALGFLLREGANLIKEIMLKPEDA